MNCNVLARIARDFMLNLPTTCLHYQIVNENPRKLKVQTTPFSFRDVPKIRGFLDYELWGIPQSKEIGCWSSPAFIRDVLYIYQHALESGYEPKKIDLKLLEAICDGHNVPLIFKTQFKRVCERLEGDDVEFDRNPFSIELCCIQNNECREFRPAGEQVNFCPKLTYGKRLVERGLINVTTFENFYLTMVDAIIKRKLVEFLS